MSIVRIAVDVGLHVDMTAQLPVIFPIIAVSLAPWSFWAERRRRRRVPGA